MIALSIVLLLVSFCLESNGVLLNYPNQLEEYLEDLKNKSITVTTLDIQLNSSVVFTISTNLTMYCCNSEPPRALIASNSDSNAVIKCVSKYYDEPNYAGFIFKYYSMVTFRFISFINCGLPVINNFTRDVLNKIRQPFVYHINHVAALVCIHCTELCLTNVTFVSSVGFSVLAIDVGFGNLQSLTVTNNYTLSHVDHNRAIGAGILFHFTRDCTEELHSTTVIRVIINNTLFYNITNDEVLPVTGVSIQEQIIPNAVGLTLLSVENQCCVDFILSDTNFTHNSGSSLLLLYHNTLTTTVSSQNLIFAYNNFSSNEHYASSASLQFYLHNTMDMSKYSGTFSPLNINNVTFHNNFKIQLFSIYLYIVQIPGIVVLVRLVNTSFVNNSLSDKASCMDVICPLDTICDINLFIENITVSNNRLKSESFETSILKFSHIRNISFRGDCDFHYNVGSVLDVIDSTLHLYDRFICHHNTAYNGGCIKTKGSSLVYFHKMLTATFSNNSAMSFGGAIFAQRNVIDLQQPPSCVFQFDGFNNSMPGLVFQVIVHVYLVQLFMQSQFSIVLCFKAIHRSVSL